MDLRFVVQVPAGKHTGNFVSEFRQEQPRPQLIDCHLLTVVQPINVEHENSCAERENPNIDISDFNVTGHIVFRVRRV